MGCLQSNVNFLQRLSNDSMALSIDHAEGDVASTGASLSISSAR
jgi:hypothetical protein